MCKCSLGTVRMYSPRQNLLLNLVIHSQQLNHTYDVCHFIMGIREWEKNDSQLLRRQQIHRFQRRRSILIEGRFDLIESATASIVGILVPLIFSLRRCLLVFAIPTYYFSRKLQTKQDYFLVPKFVLILFQEPPN